MSLTLKNEEKISGTRLIHLNGRLDLNIDTQFDVSMQHIILPPKTNVFDMSTLDYISSAGLRVVFTAALDTLNRPIYSTLLSTL